MVIALSVMKGTSTGRLEHTAQLMNCGSMVSPLPVASAGSNLPSATEICKHSCALGNLLSADIVTAPYS